MDHHEHTTTVGTNVKEVMIYAGNSPFAIRLDSGLTIHVEPDQNATLYFQKNDNSIISIKESGKSNTVSNFLKRGIVVTAAVSIITATSFWYYFQKE